MRILATGDIHIGRTSTKIPDFLSGETGSTITAWHRIVDTAVEREVELVCIAGDLIDAANRFWEALGPVEEGIKRLEENNILVLAVAGNHDQEVLPRIADNLEKDNFRLLGRNGKWERFPVYSQGNYALAMDAWSFPSSQVKTDPVHEYKPLDTQVPVLALLHGELDAPGSRHAPLDRRLMQSLPVHTWILGHMHGPPGQRQDPGFNPIFYVGSAQALDPSEYGLHGPWILEVGSQGLTSMEQVPGSDVRYEQLEVDVSGVNQEGDLDSAILNSMQDRVREVVQESFPALVYLSLRLQLTGKTPLAPELGRLVSNLADMERRILDVHVGVEKVDIQATPEIDLHEYSRSNTPPGVLAHLLLELDRSSPSGETRDLIENTRQKLQSVTKRRDFSPPEDGSQLSESAVREYLRNEARNLLNELLGQTR